MTFHRLLFTTTILATTSLAACHMQWAEGDINGSGAAIGEACLDDLDCQGGLLCSDEICAEADDAQACDGGHAPVDQGEGGDAAGGAGAGGGEAEATPACQEDADCDAGEICSEQGECATPSCEQIEDEASCLDRADCETVYAGVDCSCGQGCTCQPGDPGCVCESFEFFRCEAL